VEAIPRATGPIGLDQRKISEPIGCTNVERLSQSFILHRSFLEPIRKTEDATICRVGTAHRFQPFVVGNAHPIVSG